MGNITDNDIAAINALQKPWVDACMNRDWDSLLEICTPRIELFPPEAAMASGPDGVRAYMSEFPMMKSFTFDFTGIDGREDLAVARGTFEIIAQVEGNTVQFKGKFTDVFKKVGDDWRFDLVIWNTDHPIA